MFAAADAPVESNKKGGGMKTLQRVLVAITVVGMLAAAGCEKPLDLSMQRNRIFLMGRLLVGQTCDVRLIWRKAPEDQVPVTVTADLSEIGGEAEQELTASDNGTWRWTGKVTPDVAGERLITITEVDSQQQNKDVSKRFRVFNTDKAIAIEAGRWSGCAVKADGTVVEWSFYDGSRLDTPAGLTDVVAIEVGFYHSLALTVEGTIVTWGCEDPEWDYGQCDVPEGLTDVVAITAGSYHSLALKADGTVVYWGGGYGYPPGGLTDVVAIGAGAQRCVAVKHDGAVVSWPDNYDLSDVVSVSLGMSFDLAVQSDGTVVQINEYDEKPTALPIRVGMLKATATASGELNNIALQQDGSVVIWDSGMVFHRLKNIIAVAAFYGYMALAKDGTVIAWEEQWTENKLTELPVPDELK